MKNLTKNKTKKQRSPQKHKNNPFSNAYLYEHSQISYPSATQSKNLASSTQMLVSLNQTERFKLDFLIDSYQQLITSFKLQRKNFLQIMQTQFERHLFYYTQIITLAKTHQENTKTYLRSKLQDVSNIFQLKISLIEMKLKNTKKVLYENDFDSLFSQKKSKIKKSGSKKQLQVGKTTSYEDGIDFDQELKEIYNQKEFQVNVNLIQNQEVQQSLISIKTKLIKNWQRRESLSVSFSSVSNPDRSTDTFGEICNKLEQESEDKMCFLRGRLDQQKSSGKYQYVSNETNTSAKQKAVTTPPLQLMYCKRKYQCGGDND